MDKTHGLHTVLAVLLQPYKTPRDEQISGCTCLCTHRNAASTGPGTRQYPPSMHSNPAVITPTRREIRGDWAIHAPCWDLSHLEVIKTRQVSHFGPQPSSSGPKAHHTSPSTSSFLSPLLPYCVRYILEARFPVGTCSLALGGNRKRHRKEARTPALSPSVR